MKHNKALVRSFTTLRFVHAAQLGRWASKESEVKLSAIAICLLLASSNSLADSGVRIPGVINDQAMACSNVERWEQEQWNYAASMMPQAMKPKPVTARGSCKWLPAGKKVYLTGGRCKKLAEILVDGEMLCISLVMVDFHKP